MPANKRLYLDSSIFIYHFENSPRFSELTQKIFSLAEEGEITIGTSSLVFSEITPPIYREDKKDILAIYSTMDKPPICVEIIDLDKEVALLAGKIRAEYNFSTPDAIHLASACFGKFDYFITNDKKLRAFKELKVALITKLPVL